MYLVNTIEVVSLAAAKAYRVGTELSCAAMSAITPRHKAQYSALTWKSV